MSAALDYTYRYPYASSLDTGPQRGDLKLATCSEGDRHPYFFDGRILEPRTVADMLLVLNDVVRTHFFLPMPPNLDPVLTSSEEMLRLEGFSGCCGVYARVDLQASAFDGSVQGRGTTNVDFNNPMIRAFSRIRETEDVRLAVGTDEVALSRADETTVEKKVKLPLRWIKSFSEVQVYQPGLELKHEISGPDALKFMRTLPRSSAPKRPSFVAQSGKSLRVSQREKPGAVRLNGLHRLKVLEPLFVRAKSLRVWADNETSTSAWEAVFDHGRFLLMLSPEVFRGFSGEGQILETLAKGTSLNLLSNVRAQLKWQARIDAEAISQLLNVDSGEVLGALATLGSRGLAGYDLASAQYFHRELPFDLDQVENLQPRLKAARSLLQDGKVVLAKTESESAASYNVAGTGVTHIVRIHPDGDGCTCPWFSKYRGERGPCKHILAAQLFVDEPTSPQKV